jgi:hypothetical protein
VPGADFNDARAGVQSEPIRVPMHQHRSARARGELHCRRTENIFSPPTARRTMFRWLTSRRTRKLRASNLPAVRGAWSLCRTQSGKFPAELRADAN